MTKDNKSYIALLLLFCLISCAGVRKTTITLHELPSKTDKSTKYVLFTQSNDKIEFNKFKVTGDTLTIFGPESPFYKSAGKAYPLDQIKELYKLEYPNRLLHFIFFTTTTFAVLYAISDYLMSQW